MAVICASCQAENRDGAKFCKGCGHRLVAAPAGASAGTDDGWPVTERMPLPAAPVRAPVSAADEVTVVTGSTRSPVPAAPLQPAPEPRPQPAARAPKSAPPAAARSVARPSSASRIGAWGLLIAVVVVAGGWYAYGKRGVVTPAVAQAPAAAPTPAPIPVSPPPPAAPSASVAAAEAPVVESVQVAPPPPPIEPAAPASPAPPKAEPVKPAAVAIAPKPRKPAPAAAPAPAPQPAAVAPAVTVAAAPPPEPAAPASPEAACAGQGFFGRSRCLVAQCAKAEYRTHGQCDAVRRQQQIEEEKRNPTLLN